MQQFDDLDETFETKMRGCLWEIATVLGAVAITLICACLLAALYLKVTGLI